MTPVSATCRKKIQLLIGLVLLSAGAAACSSASTGAEYAGPTPIGVSSPTALPAARVTFHATPPEGTPSDAELSLLLLDEVSGFAYSSVDLPMEHASDGTWRVETTLPAGALIRYRYRRKSPRADDEHTALGEPVTSRVVHIAGPMVVQDLIAAWSDGPRPESTGQLRGHVVDGVRSAPLPEQIVVAAGLWAFTDSEGAFRLDGLPAGLHRITVFSPDGNYQPHQQGAVIEAGKVTPVEVPLRPAAKVQITFEVTVPSDTLPGASVRIAGNLRQFGHRFSQLPGGSRGVFPDMPAMTAVDETHYLWIAELPVGTYLRYKYTLGDGIWNAERTVDGFFNLRHLVVPETDAVLRDTVSSWRGDHGSALIQVSVPEDTPSQDLVSIQFSPASTASPLPMMQIGDHEWFFVLYGPQDFTSPLPYRYCRNLQCGIADEGAASSADAPVRELRLEIQGTAASDVIQSWKWWIGGLQPAGIIAPQILPRRGFQAGVEFLPAYRPEWKPWIFQALEGVAEGGSNAVTLTPAWIVRRGDERPSLAFDPAFAPYRDELLGFIQAAGELGLAVSLRPTLLWPENQPEVWWMASARDSAWWEDWFDLYARFALSYAALAAESGASGLVLGGWEIEPSLPAGLLFDGSSSGAPADAGARWRSLIREIRGVFFGRLAFELELGEAFPDPPSFLGLFDEVHLHWHPSLRAGDDLQPASMRAQAARWLNTVLGHPALASTPLVLSVAYPSIEGGASGCVPSAEGACLRPSTLDAGAGANAAIPVDLDEQALAINAVLLAAYDRREVMGFYVRGYNPVVALQDQSTSVHGKPAAEVLWYWFPRIIGRETTGGSP